MTTGVACPIPILQFFNNAGQPAIGGSVLTQVGNVNAATYQDINLTVPLPNPIPLNSRGEVSNAAGASTQLFLTPNTAYTFTLFDANGNQLNQATYVSAMASTQAGIGQLLYPQNAFEQSASVTPTAYQYEDLPEFLAERYGFVGDGATNNDTAFSNVIAVATAAGGGVLKLPPGNFAFNTLITMPPNFTIIGSGYSATFLRANNSNSGILVPNTSGRCGLRNLALYSNTVGTGTGLQIGDTISQASLAVFQDLVIANWNTGIRLAGAIWTNFTNVEVAGCMVGVDFNAGNNTLYSTTVDFIRCLITGNTNAGVKATSVPIANEKVTFYQCSIQLNCASATSQPELKLSDGTGLVEAVTIDSCYFEGVSTAITAIDPQNIIGLRISNCYSSGNRNYFIHDALTNSVISGVIFGNVIGTCATAPIYLSNETDVVAFCNHYAGTVTLTGSGCTNLPTGSGIASWPTNEVAWSPVLTPASSGSITGQVAVAYYSQVGNVVTAQATITWTGVSSPVGGLTITGFPVQPKTNLPGVCAAGYFTGITISSASQIGINLASGGTTATVYECGATAAAVNTASAVASGGGTLNFCMTYQI